jgi:NADH-quinone oxidoreductase subunit N
VVEDQIYKHIFPIIPELFLVVFAMAILLAGAFSKAENKTRTLTRVAMAAMVITIGLLTRIWEDTFVVFNGLFISDSFAVFVKIIILIASVLVLFISLEPMRQQRKNYKVEYPVLILLAVVGMMLMVSANNLLSLYMGLELQSLSLYVLASFNRESRRSSEAGMKYFVLGALASGFLLYGCSLIYGFTGSTSFTTLAEVLTAQEYPSIGVVIGLVFILVGLCFKVSAVPFHMWTPDVYEGAPTPVTAFFATAPKVAAIALFIRVLMQPFNGLIDEWQQVIIFVSAGSMIVGAVAALKQTNIKRLLAYSSIGHVGYILLGLAAGTADGVQGALVYLAIYVIMTVGVFACVLRMRRADEYTEEISDFAGLSRKQPLLALTLTILMFSMTGVPPMAGFFGKFLVFRAAIEGELYILAVIGVLTSVVAAFYYLRIVKIMYFTAEESELDLEISFEAKVVLSIAALFNVFFFLQPIELFDLAKMAALTLI